MRLGSLTLSATLSAALLSGCSFFSGDTGQFENQQAAQYGQYGQGFINQHCQIASPRQPIPRGCRPEQVTIGVPSQAQYGAPAFGAQNFGTTGFPQQPQFGQPQYTSGGYGAAVGQTAAVSHHTAKPKKRKPKLRGSLSVGLEPSISGDLIDFDDFAIDAIALYNPQDFNEGFITGSDSTGDEVRTTYTANQRITGGDFFAPNTFEEIIAPNISYADAWITPVKISGGLEYIANDSTTFFANVGYAYAEGNDDTGASVQATIFEVTETGIYDTVPAVPAVAATDTTPAVPGVAAQFTRTGTSRSAAFVPNQEIAQFDFEFSDLHRFDLEAGARQYFKPFVKSAGFRTVTPFVGASAGASHYDRVDVSISQRQRFYERAFELGGGEITDETPPQFYDIAGEPTTITIFDDQWVPAGQVNVGAEWQVTPGAALAFESGVRVEQGRRFSNGERADTNITIPFTLRGSVNF